MNDLRSSIRNILKNVFLWIAFLTLSLSVLGCGGSSASIKAVLQRDHALAQKIQSPYNYSGSGSLDEYMDCSAQTIFWYVNEARKFDTNSVPADFAVAYREHLAAWENHGQIVMNHPVFGTFTSNFFEGFVRGLMGDLTGGAFEKEALFNNWAAQVDRSNQKISSTWRDVENCALKYGVNISE